MNLPEIFEMRMKDLLKNEYTAFRNALECSSFSGLRINTLKISVEEFLKISPFKLTPIPWVPEGFYFEEGVRPGKHPYYHAGLYYIQEPSAMFPVTLLDPKPGELILDACAAPGGKTCQIAAAMNGKGVIITNDISATRAKSLLHNVELSGITNAVVTCEDPTKLLKVLEGKVDAMLLDAPCSGEGMFRRTDAVMKAWTPDAPEKFRALQNPLLASAGKLVAPGGRLVYSTCTFNSMENEDAVRQFLHENSSFKGETHAVPDCFSGFTDENGQCPSAFYRLWPHRIQGEGHFAARLIRDREGRASVAGAQRRDGLAPEAFRAFVDKNIIGWNDSGSYKLIGEKLMLLPEIDLDFSGLRVLRSGWYLGDVKKGRFEPSQALAMGLRMKQVRTAIDFSPDNLDVLRYLKGETIFTDCEQGWILVGVSGHPLGWAKGVDGMLKNHYPATWRWMD